AQVSGIGAARLRTLIAAFQSVAAARHAPHGAIAALPGFSRAAATAIRSSTARAGHEVLEQLDRQGAPVLLPDDPAFPPLLAEIPDPPECGIRNGECGMSRMPSAPKRLPTAIPH
ncbi:MAG TPA: hypothetical protein VH137_07105, partial [Gemmatimonadales bacterium]|nr:hypothetical protein [Gemmatimonadales bacterium]